MPASTVHLYFDGNSWRVRSETGSVPLRGPYQTYHAADCAAHALAQDLGADERHHDAGEVMRDVCDRPDDPPGAATESASTRPPSLRHRMKRAMRRLLGRHGDGARCRLERVGRDPRAALAADKRHWTRTMAEIEQLLSRAGATTPDVTKPTVPDEPGEPHHVDPPVPADLSRELESVLRGLPRAGDLTVEFWQAAERDGLAEAFDRLSIALADSGRDLSRLRAMIGDERST